MDFITRKYIGMMSQRLERFKVSNNSPYRANFRCPICGDSSKDKRKTRGWFLEKSGEVIVYCHNCFYSHRLSTFLKDVDVGLYNDYVSDIAFEKFGSKRKSPDPQLQPREESAKSNSRQDNINDRAKKAMGEVKSIDKLSSDHIARIYVEKRCVPKESFNKIFFVGAFNKWVNSILSNKLQDKFDSPRIVFPLITGCEESRLFGVVGRDITGKSSLRYLTILFDDDEQKIYGMDTVDVSKRYFVLEGPFDSMFVDNSVAMCGADVDVSQFPNHNNAVMVYDNEPRNKSIINKMNKDISEGRCIVIWPSHLKSKDINQMFETGELSSSDDVDNLLGANIFSGEMAKLKLSFWQKR